MMEFYMKLPRNKKEFPIFMAVISIISVLTIAPLITCFEMGFTMTSVMSAVKSMPFIWVSVVVVVLLTHGPSEWLAHKILSKGDSFRACMVINALCAVFLISIFMTVIGAWIGMRQISMIPIYSFFYKWPRNFAIALAIETLVAQPIARFVMLKMHQAMDAKAKNEEVATEEEAA